MSGPKTEFNNQAGLISADGAADVPSDVVPLPVGDGTYMLLDRFGRPYINARIVSGSVSGGSNIIIGERPPTAANSLTNLPVAAMPVAGSIQVMSPDGKLYGVMLSTDQNLRVYFQMYNIFGVPAGTPLLSVPVPPASDNKPLVLDLSPIGFYFSTGIRFAISTTPLTFTAPPPIPSAWWFSLQMTP
jgi:hypothetical protein